MGFTGWTAAVGLLFLLVSLTSGWIRRMPVTTFGIYLLAGIAAGPWGLRLLDIHFLDEAGWLTHATDIALVVSLFITGLKLRVPWRNTVWRTVFRLAFPAMVLTILTMAWLAHVLAGMSWPYAILLGAMLAPTDPVLASMITVSDARDRDRLRIALSGEAGLNDGLALPFLMLALLMIGGTRWQDAWVPWLITGFAWNIAAGLAIGFGLGWLLGLLGARMRTATADVTPGDYLAFALMALAYVAAVSAHASGFLAAFAAGVGLRHAEVLVVARHPHRKSGERPHDGESHPPAEMLVSRHALAEVDARQPAETMGLMVSDALSFGDTLERLIASAAVFLIGASLANYWSMTGLLLAGLLFVLVRPAAVCVSTIGSGLPMPRRLLLGWLGIRGIGTLNYVLYAISHEVDGGPARMLAHIAITVVAASIIIHGMTTPPLMAWREARLATRRGGAESAAASDSAES